MNVRQRGNYRHRAPLVVASAHYLGRVLRRHHTDYGNPAVSTSGSRHALVFYLTRMPGDLYRIIKLRGSWGEGPPQKIVGRVKILMI